MRILRKPETVHKTGYSAVQIWRMERRGDFPKRVQLGPNAVGWLEHEVDRWIADRAAARDGKAAAG